MAELLYTHKHLLCKQTALYGQAKQQTNSWLCTYIYTVYIYLPTVAGRRPIAAVPLPAPRRNRTYQSGPALVFRRWERPPPPQNLLRVPEPRGSVNGSIVPSPAVGREREPGPGCVPDSEKQSGERPIGIPRNNHGLANQIVCVNIIQNLRNDGAFFFQLFHTFHNGKNHFWGVGWLGQLLTTEDYFQSSSHFF